MLAGFDCKGVKSGKSKEIRAKPLAVQAEVGNIILQKSHWNAIFLSELHNFTDSGSGHDDIVDATSGAFNQLTSVYIHPTVSEEKKEELTDDDRAILREKAYLQYQEDFLNCTNLD